MAPGHVHRIVPRSFGLYFKIPVLVNYKPLVTISGCSAFLIIIPSFSKKNSDCRLYRAESERVRSCYSVALSVNALKAT